MAQFTGYPQLMGFLPPDERITHANLRTNDAGAGNSTYTQAGRRPGRPVYAREAIAESSTTIGDLGPHVDIVPTGDQAETTYTVTTLQGGMPGDAFEVAVSDDSGTTWRGWQTHNVAEWAPADATYGRDGTTYGHNYCLTPLANGKVLCASSGSGGLIRCKVYDPTTHTIDAAYTTIGNVAAAQFNDDAKTHAPSPLFSLRLAVTAWTRADGRVYLYSTHAEIGSEAGVSMNMGVWYSDDHGVTWRSANFFALDANIDPTVDTIDMIRCAEHNGNVLLLVGYSVGGAYRLYQYASSDGGINFDLVEDWNDTTTPGRFPAVVVDRATGIYTVFYYDPTSTDVKYRRIANPFVPLLSVTATTHSANNATHIVAYADTDGMLYVTWANSDIIEMAWSRDGGATWSTYGTPPVAVGQGAIDTWEICAQSGRGVWLLADNDGPLTPENLVVAEFGGWNTIVQPKVTSLRPTENNGFGGNSVLSEGQTWFPLQLPSAYNWAVAGAGTATLATAAPLGVTLVTTAAQTKTYTRNPAGLVTDGVEVFFSLTVSAGGGIGANNVGLFLDLDDAVSRYAIHLNFSTTQVELYKVALGANVATVNLDMTVKRLFKVAMRPDRPDTFANVTVYYRSETSDEWTVLISNLGTIAKSATATGTNVIRWGHAVNAASTSIWGPLHYTMRTGRGASGTGGYYDDLSVNVLVANSAPFLHYGKRLPALPFRAFIDAGLYLHGSGGPALRGDKWTLAPAYDYGAENLDPRISPSPAAPWRSTAEALARFTWTIGGGSGAYATDFGCSSWGCIIRGANIPTAEIRRWDGAAMQVVGTIDFRGGMVALSYAITGDRLIVNTGVSVTAARYIHYDELVGCTVKLVNGGTTVYRKVLHNTEGAFTNQTTRRPTLILDGIDGTEPATGTMDIWYRDAAFIVHENANTFTRVALQLPAQATADGYFTLGSVLIGAAIIPGQRHAHGRMTDTAQNVEVYTGLGGQRSARLLGPPRRRATVALSDAFDASEVQQASPVPGYVALKTGGLPVGNRGDLSLLEGLLRRFGAQVPIGLLPRLALTDSGSDYTQVAGREHVFVGRMMEQLTRTTTNGEEDLSEVVTVTGMAFDEEL